jgi:hypothetical protein
MKPAANHHCVSSTGPNGPQSSFQFTRYAVHESRLLSQGFAQEMAQVAGV